MKRLPKSFFEKERPIISAKESFKDISPVEWKPEIMDGSKKAVVKSGNEGNKKNYV